MDKKPLMFKHPSLGYNLLDPYKVDKMVNKARENWVTGKDRWYIMRLFSFEYPPVKWRTV